MITISPTAPLLPASEGSALFPTEGTNSGGSSIILYLKVAESDN